MSVLGGGLFIGVIAMWQGPGFMVIVVMKGAWNGDVSMVVKGIWSELVTFLVTM